MMDRKTSEITLNQNNFLALQINFLIFLMIMYYVYFPILYNDNIILNYTLSEGRRQKDSIIFSSASSIII